MTRHDHRQERDLRKLSEDLPHVQRWHPAPHNGSISGCPPLDDFYKSKPEFAPLKEARWRTGV